MLQGALMAALLLSTVMVGVTAAFYEHRRMPSRWSAPARAGVLAFSVAVFLTNLAVLHARVSHGGL